MRKLSTHWSTQKRKKTNFKGGGNNQEKKTNMKIKDYFFTVFGYLEHDHHLLTIQLPVHNRQCEDLILTRVKSSGAESKLRTPPRQMTIELLGVETNHSLNSSTGDGIGPNVNCVHFIVDTIRFKRIFGRLDNQS